MALPALLLACLLLGPASSLPSSAAPEDTVSRESRPLQLPTSAETTDATTLDKAKAELVGFCQAAARAATAGALGELTKTLASIQASVTDLSGRLDALQLQQKHAQTSLAEKVAALSGRVDTSLQNQRSVEDQLDAIQTAVDRIPKMVLGKDCSNDTDCSRVLPEAVCGGGGRCQCREGFRQVSDASCRKHSRLTEPCREDADCRTLVNNTICFKSVCSCAYGFWNYNDAECRPISAVNMHSSCVGDQDCDSSLHLACITGTCSCPSLETAVGGYEYRLAGGDACNEGNVELRKEGDDDWGVVCHDDWDATDAGVACRSLGFKTGVPTEDSQFGGSWLFYMDNVECGGSESHLMECDYRGWRRHNCLFGEVAGVICQN